MEISSRNVALFFAFVACNYFCFAKDNIRVGAFFNEEQLTVPINWKIMSNHSDHAVIAQPETHIVPDTDRFESVNRFCEFFSKDDGFSAIFGPKSLAASATFESICFHLQVPYITTTWKPKTMKHFPTSFNLYPDADLLSQGLATIIKGLDWKEFVVLYQNEESLMKLQDVIKLQEHKQGSDKNSIWLKQLGPGPDYRPLLKEVKNSTHRRIVLDCDTDKIVEIMSQAKQVNLLADISTNVFLTSMDAHIIDFSPELNTGANVTTVRLFSPYQNHFKNMINNYFPGISPEEILVQTALTHDAMVLFSETMKSLWIENPETDFSSYSKFCNATKYEDELGIVAQMSKTVVQETQALTGEISLENGRRTMFKLEVIEVDKPVKPIAIWYSKEPNKLELTRNATERELELQKRIQNHNFIVTSKLIEPYLMDTFKIGAPENERYEGYSMDLITEISKILNMTFRFVIRDKTPTIVEDLVLRRADLGICDFTITHQRREIIDFSMPFMSLGISILHKKVQQEEIDNMYAFMRPFSWTVWVYTVTLYLILSIIIFFVSRMDPDDWENPHPCDQNPEELENIWGIKNCLWLTLGSIMTQGCDILPKGISSRIATAMWWFFSLIMTSTYTANLAAFLTMQKKGDSINSVEDLANQNKIKYGLMEDGATQAFFEFSNNSLYQKMWNTMKNENPSVFESTNAKGFERVVSNRNGLYAFFMESTQIEYELERNCNLRKIGQWLDSKSFGIGMPLNVDYADQINNAILTLQENGKLNELKDLWWKKKLKGEPCSTSSEEGISDELSLGNLGGVFVVLSVGIGIAFLIAILEFLWNVRNISVEEHISYLEALKVELKFACNIAVTKKRAKPVISESSTSSTDGQSVGRTILAGAGSFLNINTTVLNRIGASLYNNN
ncbi:glutamate receptor ionotropic, kainate 2-like [Cylas formicarius]|uniref:glutamate receptor ionotropic, kainate 2-like n=1 Tax=Cylas formicarius TaxID=197179 RepID=UPI002958A233|nr:glutamate receptor ionotropic, kainate 2-like [Cylas formicarius]XP_060528958.1 glutamate receptor ionotropic, kainate 2-like [Cylas formicarius]